MFCFKGAVSDKSILVNFLSVLADYQTADCLTGQFRVVTSSSNMFFYNQ